MKVHFTGSSSLISEKIDVYRTIISVIRSQGHVLTRDWTEDAYKRSKSGKNIYSDNEWKEIFNKTVPSIVKADVVIIEASSDSFSMGYQAALAIHHNKPTLLLVDQQNRDSSFIEGSNSTLKRKEIYKSMDQVTKMVGSFLKDNDVKKKDMRFDMFFDRETFNYLRWESYKTGKTKAQLIRDLVRDKINQNEA